MCSVSAPNAQLCRSRGDSHGKGHSSYLSLRGLHVAHQMKLAPLRKRHASRGSSSKRRRRSHRGICLSSNVHPRLRRQIEPFGSSLRKQRVPKDNVLPVVNVWRAALGTSHINRRHCRRIRKLFPRVNHVGVERRKRRRNGLSKNAENLDRHGERNGSAPLKESIGSARNVAKGRGVGFFDANDWRQLHIVPRD